jgi:hypothetical protein
MQEPHFCATLGQEEALKLGSSFYFFNAPGRCPTGTSGSLISGADNDDQSKRG